MDESPDHAPMFIARLLAGVSQAQLFVDDAMNDLTVVGRRDDCPKPMALLQTILVERFLHRKPRPEQAHCREARGLDLSSGRIGDVKQRYMDCRLDRSGHFMHGVRTQDQKVGACSLEASRRIAHQLTGSLPIPCALQSFNVMEIDAIENNLRRMKAAQ